MTSAARPRAEPAAAGDAAEAFVTASRRVSWAQGLDRRVARLFFATGAWSAVAGLPMLMALDSVPSPTLRLVGVGAVAVVALAFGFAWWRLPRLDLGRAVMGCGWVASTAIAVVAFALGEGVRAVGLGALALLLACVVVVAGRRQGLWMAAGQAVLIAMLAAGEWGGLLPGAGATPPAPLWMLVGTHALMLGAGLAAGMLIAAVVRGAIAQSRQREQRFRALLQMAADWYWEMDGQFRYTALTENYENATGLPAGSGLGLAPWEMEDFGLGDEQLDAHRADLEAHRAFSGLVVRRRDRHGRLRYLSVSGQPRFDTGGRFTGYWGVGRDVTREVAAQRARASSEARYRELFARSPTALMLHRAGTIVEANAAAARMFGFPSAEAMTNLRIIDWLVPPEQRAQVEQRLAAIDALPAGEALPVVESDLLTQRGDTVRVESTAVRVETPHGLAALSIFHDVTERLAAQAALRRSETLLSLLVATSPDAITLTEMATGRYLMVNDTFLRLTGYAREDVIGRTSLEIGLWSPQTRASIVDGLRQHGRLSDLPVKVRTKSGDTLQLMVSAARFSLGEEHYLVTNSRDISASERSRLEREAILDNASVGISLTRDRRVLMANRRLEQMLGYGRDEMVGRATRLVWPSDVAYEAVADEVTPRLARGETVEVEQELQRRDGSTVWCRLLARSVDVADPAEGTIWIIEDITERRAVQAALAKARDDAQAASRAKSAFLANMSHEIRTPLNAMIGLARLALSPDADGTRRAGYLRQIHDSAQGLSAIISDILDLSKIEAGKLLLEVRGFDLHALAAEVHAAHAPLAEQRGLRLSLAIDPRVPRDVRGDAMRLRQILGNFTANAIKFTESGEVFIALTAASPPGEPLRVRLGVLDTGPGVDRAAQPRLFQPFSQADESTTRRFGGTGLGLSICRQLAELMGGRVGLDSEPGRGSHFWAEVPLEPVPAGTAGPAGPDTSAEGPPLPAGARVLLVEDNPVNMLVACALLEQWGLDVAQAGDGAQAVHAVLQAQAGGRPFDLVLMDVQMPVMSGHEAARRLREQFDAQSLPIIALTAAALVNEREEALAAGMNDFLTKPIDPPRLRAALRRHLRRAQADTPAA